MKRIRRTGLFVMAAALLLGAAPLKAYAADAPKGMDKVAENEYLTLYLNDKDTSLAVVDNATGKVWYTNPQDEDPFASAFYQRLLKSQLQILYYNENVQSSTMDNYNDSIQDEQFTIEETETA